MNRHNIVASPASAWWWAAAVAVTSVAVTAAAWWAWRHAPWALAVIGGATWCGITLHRWGDDLTPPPDPAPDHRTPALHIIHHGDDL